MPFFRGSGGNVVGDTYKVLFSNGTDFMGYKLVLDETKDPAEPVWACKKNAEPANITYANADFIALFGSASAPDGGAPF